MQRRLTSPGDTPKSCQSNPAILVNLRCISTFVFVAGVALRHPPGSPAVRANIDGTSLSPRYRVALGVNRPRPEGSRLLSLLVG